VKNYRLRYRYYHIDTTSNRIGRNESDMKFDHFEVVDIVTRELEKYKLDVQATHERNMDIDILAVLPNEIVLKIKVRYVSPSSRYTFVRQDKFDVDDKLLYMAVLYDSGSETREVYLLPASNWKRRAEHFMTKNYDKVGQISEPEYGITFSGRTIEDISSYRLPFILDRMLHK
jgi:hypothetical protein